MRLFWEKAQERITSEFEMNRLATREGMVDVYVALKQLKRSGSRSVSKPQALEGAQLDQVLMGMARQFPQNVKVVNASS